MSGKAAQTSFAKFICAVLGAVPRATWYALTSVNSNGMLRVWACLVCPVAPCRRHETPVARFATA